MNKDILINLEKIGSKFKNEGSCEDVLITSKRLVHGLQFFLDFNPTPDEVDEQKGEGDCVTAFKYFSSSLLGLIPSIDVAPRLVQKSDWEPSNKKNNIHIVAQVNQADRHLIYLDPTHYPGAGYGQTYEKYLPHATTGLTKTDLIRVDKARDVRSLYAKGSQISRMSAENFLGLSLPSYMGSWISDVSWLLAEDFINEYRYEESIGLLRLALDNNPYKARIGKSLRKLANVYSQPERLAGLQDKLEQNLHELKLSALSAQADYEQKARISFQEGDVQQGLGWLRYGWWTGTIADPQQIHREVKVSDRLVEPSSFVKQALRTIWVNPNEVDQPRLRDIQVIHSSLLQPYKYTRFGYRPIDLLPTTLCLPEEVLVLVIRPSSNFSFPKTIINADGIEGHFYSVGILHPYLTSVDKFSVRLYQSIEKEFEGKHE